jgi:Co/Zn/Cd efflux system component
VALVALLNAAYFGVEFVVALWIGSVSLFADSIDFLEDTSINVLILLALRWSARWRARGGTVLAGLLLAPAVAVVWDKLQTFAAPAPVPLSWTAAGALAVNLCCALILVRHRAHAGSLSRAAFLSARNDALANVAMLAAAGVRAYWPSAWPDLVVGLGIAAINSDAAREVWHAAREEGGAARA